MSVTRGSEFSEVMPGGEEALGRRGSTAAGSGRSSVGLNDSSFLHAEAASPKQLRPPSGRTSLSSWDSHQMEFSDVGRESSSKHRSHVRTLGPLSYSLPGTPQGGEEASFRDGVAADLAREAAQGWSVPPMPSDEINSGGVALSSFDQADAFDRATASAVQGTFYLGGDGVSSGSSRDTRDHSPHVAEEEEEDMRYLSLPLPLAGGGDDFGVGEQNEVHADGLSVRNRSYQDMEEGLEEKMAGGLAMDMETEMEMVEGMTGRERGHEALTRKGGVGDKDTKHDQFLLPQQRQPARTSPLSPSPVALPPPPPPPPQPPAPGHDTFPLSATPSIAESVSLSVSEYGERTGQESGSMSGHDEAMPTAAAAATAGVVQKMAEELRRAGVVLDSTLEDQIASVLAGRGSDPSPPPRLAGAAPVAAPNIPPSRSQEALISRALLPPLPPAQQRQQTQTQTRTQPAVLPAPSVDVISPTAAAGALGSRADNPWGWTARDGAGERVEETRARGVSQGVDSGRATPPSRDRSWTVPSPYQPLDSKFSSAGSVPSFRLDGRLDVGGDSGGGRSGGSSSGGSSSGSSSSVGGGVGAGAAVTDGVVESWRACPCGGAIGEEGGNSTARGSMVDNGDSLNAWSASSSCGKTDVEGVMPSTPGAARVQTNVRILPRPSARTTREMTAVDVPSDEASLSTGAGVAGGSSSPDPHARERLARRQTDIGDIESGPVLIEDVNSRSYLGDKPLMGMAEQAMTEDVPSARAVAGEYQGEGAGRSRMMRFDDGQSDWKTLHNRRGKSGAEGRMSPVGSGEGEETLDFAVAASEAEADGLRHAGEGFEGGARRLYHDEEEDEERKFLEKQGKLGRERWRGDMDDGHMVMALSEAQFTHDNLDPRVEGVATARELGKEDDKVPGVDSVDAVAAGGGGGPPGIGLSDYPLKRLSPPLFVGDGGATLTGEYAPSHEGSDFGGNDARIGDTIDANVDSRRRRSWAGGGDAEGRGAFPGTVPREDTGHEEQGEEGQGARESVQAQPRASSQFVDAGVPLVRDAGMKSMELMMEGRARPQGATGVAAAATATAAAVDMVASAGGHQHQHDHLHRHAHRHQHNYENHGDRQGGGGGMEVDVPWTEHNSSQQRDVDALVDDDDDGKMIGSDSQPNSGERESRGREREEAYQEGGSLYERDLEDALALLHNGGFVLDREQGRVWRNASFSSSPGGDQGGGDQDDGEEDVSDRLGSGDVSRTAAADTAAAAPADADAIGAVGAEYEEAGTARVRGDGMVIRSGGWSNPRDRGRHAGAFHSDHHYDLRDHGPEDGEDSVARDDPLDVSELPRRGGSERRGSGGGGRPSRRKHSFIFSETSTGSVEGGRGGGMPGSLDPASSVWPRTAADFAFSQECAESPSFLRGRDRGMSIVEAGLMGQRSGAKAFTDEAYDENGRALRSHTKRDETSSGTPGHLSGTNLVLNNSDVGALDGVVSEAEWDTPGHSVSGSFVAPLSPSDGATAISAAPVETLLHLRNDGGQMAKPLHSSVRASGKLAPSAPATQEKGVRSSSRNEYSTWDRAGGPDTDGIFRELTLEEAEKDGRVSRRSRSGSSRGLAAVDGKQVGDDDIHEAFGGIATSVSLREDSEASAMRGGGDEGIDEEEEELLEEMDELESFDLRVVYAKGKTGFQESKAFDWPEGSMVAGRYEVCGYIGKAAFSTALECRDLRRRRGSDAVCLKVIKNNKDFFDQSLDEIKLLQRIKAGGNPDEHHVLHMLDFFYFEEHLVIVSELLGNNLYEFAKAVKEAGHPEYFTLPRLCKIARQCLEALSYVNSLGLVHCDVKPENILLSNYGKAEVKLIDFGSSCFVTDRLTSYTQSRSYRAPEVILGLRYGVKVDVWSLGAVVAELITGQVLLQSKSVQTMLARIQGIVGPFPRWMLLEGEEAPNYFTPEGCVYQRTDDHSDEMPDLGSSGGESPRFNGSSAGDLSRRSPAREAEGIDNDKDGIATGRVDARYALIHPKQTSLKERLQVDDEDFVAFVEKLLSVDPTRRPTAKNALRHPWIRAGINYTEEELWYPPEDRDHRSGGDDKRNRSREEDDIENDGGEVVDGDGGIHDGDEERDVNRRGQRGSPLSPPVTRRRSV